MACRWVVFALFMIACAAPPSRAQDLEISGLAGYGVTGGDDQDAAGTAGFGASLLWPATSRHAFQFDYLFGDFKDRIFNRHFLTGSYVLQGRGRVSPMLQVGAGAVITSFDARVVRVPPGAPRPAGISTTETDFTLLVGAGFTIDASPRLFLRPQVRLYAYAGPTVTLVPSLAVGWRF